MGVKTIKAKVLPDFSEFDAALAERSALLNVLRPQATMLASAPALPPAEWFEIPEPDGLQPLRYEPDGRVYGHIAAWDSCHRGFVNGSFSECVRPPRSASNYEQFHLGHIRTADGKTVPVGKITFDTTHAPLAASLSAATRHYDDTGTVGAYVRAKDGEHGIWVSGVLRSDLDEAQVQRLRASPPSGDWRLSRGSLELIAALAVPVPGFAVPQLALAASGEVQALVLPSWEVAEAPEPEQEPEPAAPPPSPAQIRERYLLEQRVLNAAVLTSERRKRLPDSAFAIPEKRAYPIHDRAHAANALARSSGKPEEARVRRAVCRRYPDLPACRERS